MFHGLIEVWLEHQALSPQILDGFIVLLLRFENNQKLVAWLSYDSQTDLLSSINVGHQYFDPIIQNLRCVSLIWGCVHDRHQLYHFLPEQKKVHTFAFYRDLSDLKLEIRDGSMRVNQILVQERNVLLDLQLDVSLEDLVFRERDLHRRVLLIVLAKVT